MSRPRIAIAVAFASLLARQVVEAQQTPMEVRAFLMRVARGEERVPPPAELVVKLSGWLAAESPSMRIDALGFIEARIATFRFSASTEPGGVLSPEERDALRTLTPVVQALFLGDRDARVRRSALNALGYLGMTTTRGRSGDLLVEPAILDVVARALPNETDDGIRALIVTSLAHSENDTPTVRAALSAALADPYPGVLAAALFGVANRTPASDLATAVRLLRHEDARVRVVAGQAVGAYGARATSFLEDVRRQLAIETDDIARKTLGGTIEAIETDSRGATPVR